MWSWWNAWGLWWTPEQCLWIACATAIAAFVQTVSGFGAMLVMVSLGAQVMPIQEVICVFLPIHLFQPAFIVLKDKAHVRKDVLTQCIIPWMMPGLLCGFGVSSLTQNNWFKRIFGVFVIVVALRSLLHVLGGVVPAKSRGKHNASKRSSRHWVLAAGIMHGLYATGGPMLVYALSTLHLDRHALRSTLASVWLCMGLMLVSLFVWRGSVTLSTLTLSVGLLPLLACGVVFGQWVHARISERLCSMCLFSLLALAGVALIL